MHSYEKNHEEEMKLKFETMSQGLSPWLCTLVFMILFLSKSAFAQYAIKWMDIGSFQTFFSSAGCEYEEQRGLDQQDGDRWPAIYPYQDMQAAKGLWIGVRNWKDVGGTVWPYKVVHFGPRPDGDVTEFVPQVFMTTDRFSLPGVFVDGNPSYNIPPDEDNTNSSLKEDRLIFDSVKTYIGLTMVRKMIGFSQQFHDNYIIYDYTFTNSSNQPLDSIRVQYQYRYAVCYETRYIVGSNSAGWGINTDNDTRGDGLGSANAFIGGQVLKSDSPTKDDDIRAQYSWQGNYNNYSVKGMPGLGNGAPPSDNIGAPIWVNATAVTPGHDSPPAADTLGRLGAAQFIGVATLHADKSASDTTDDPSEPTTTAYISSDDPFNQSNSISQFNESVMQSEYQMMSVGHGVGWINGAVSWSGQRMADKVGIYGDPSIGTTGGMTTSNCYGPYNLAPGQSFHIVMTEAAAGLSREACIRVGRQFKLGNLTPAQKDDSVYTGKDSLFQTFRRALVNYNSGYNLPEPPLPPASFTVSSGGDRIQLSWTAPSGGPTITGYNIYRAYGLIDSTYYLIKHCDPSELSYDDLTPVRGFDYYYYITAVGNSADNNGAANTPAGALESNRYYTQTYDPARLLRPGVGAPITSTFTVDHVKSPPRVGSLYTNGSAIFTVQSLKLTSGVSNGDTVYSGTIVCRGTDTPPDTGLIVRNTGIGDSLIHYSALNKKRIGIGDVIRVVPNPYNISSTENVLRYPSEPNQIGFLDIPPICTIKIYTELGQLIKTIQHTNGSGDEYLEPQYIFRPDCRQRPLYRRHSVCGWTNSHKKIRGH